MVSGFGWPVYFLSLFMVHTTLKRKKKLHINWISFQDWPNYPFVEQWKTVWGVRRWFWWRFCEHLGCAGCVHSQNSLFRSFKVFLCINLCYCHVWTELQIKVCFKILFSKSLSQETTKLWGGPHPWESLTLTFKSQYMSGPKVSISGVKGSKFISVWTATPLPALTPRWLAPQAH